MLNRSFINNTSAQKSEVEKLRTQIASQKRVSKPSDDPKSAARIINLSGQFESASRYIDNIDKSLTFLNQTTLTMENILNEISRIDIKITELQNSALEGNEAMYANELSLSLDALLDMANEKFEGKYIFGGTDFSAKPFEYAAGKSYVKQAASDVSGELKVKVSANNTQKINVSGAELFGTIVKFDGNFNGEDPVGSVINKSQAIYDVDGNEYQLNTTINKTADYDYEITYDITDSSGASILTSTPDKITMNFDKTTGLINKINGISPKPVAIQALDGKINFNLDLKNITESTGSTNISSEINQKYDIFNVIAKIRDQVKAGDQPDAELVQSVKEFHQNLLNKLAEAGAVTNRLMDNQTMLENQQTDFQQVLASEQEVDVVSAITQLQYYDYLLQVSYKMSSMILPKSIMDYI